MRRSLGLRDVLISMMLKGQGVLTGTEVKFYNLRELSSLTPTSNKFWHYLFQLKMSAQWD